MKAKKIYLADILCFLGSSVHSVDGYNEEAYIDNLADVQNTVSTTLDWINPSKKKNTQTIAENSLAKTIITGDDVEYTQTIQEQGKCIIRVDNPKKAIALIGNHFFLNQEERSIHPTAIISPKAKIGNNVYIGPYVIIGESTIGDNSYISPFVRLYDDVVIGSNCTIKEGAVIGGTGFGFEIDEEGNHFRFPQLGGVIIGNNVEIGANTCIDRGALTDTVIGDFTKIDNLCHIAHNNKIGNNCIITSGTQIAGSNIIGDNIWFGPNSTIKEWCGVESDSLVGIGSVVIRKVKSGTRVFGIPADKIEF